MSEYVARAIRLRIECENPVTRKHAEILQALIEESLNLQSCDPNPRESQINQIRIEVALSAMEAIPADVWALWNEPEKASTVAVIREECNTTFSPLAGWRDGRRAILT